MSRTTVTKNPSRGQSAAILTPNTAIHAGVDVSRATLSLCILHPRKGESHHELPNSPEGISKALQKLRTADLVVLEPTGKHHRPLVRALQKRGIAFALPNPRRTADFARALHGKAKSDPLDARGLAHFGQVMQPEPLQHLSLSQAQQELSELWHHRLALVTERTAQENRLRDADLAITRRHLEDLLDLLSGQIAQVEAEIERRIAADQELARRRALLESAPGVGTLTAMALLCLLPELGRLGGKQASALVGLAPFVRESGERKGESSIGGGRTEARNALYMAALSATQHNAPIREFHQRLLAAGKPPKAALVASAHKLLLQLNSMLHHNEPFSENPPTRKKPRNPQNP